MAAPEPVPAPAPASPLSLLLLALGGVVLAYGLVILAPLVPTAAWTGVLDSASAGPGPGRSFPGRDASRTVTLHLHGISTGRTFSVPADATLTPESFKTGDTVHTLVGWGSFRELPAAVSLTRGGTTMIDSTIVLGAQRTQRARVSLVGLVLLVAGLVMLVRSRRRANA